MKTIYKFTLSISDEQELIMPAESKILQTVQIQNGEVVIWAFCTPSDKTEKVKIVTLGTGNRIPEEITSEKLVYIGTYQKDWFVGHVFIKKA